MQPAQLDAGALLPPAEAKQEWGQDRLTWRRDFSSMIWVSRFLFSLWTRDAHSHWDGDLGGDPTLAAYFSLMVSFP